MTKPVVTVECAFSVNPGSQYRTEVLADSPAGYWRLGEASGSTAADQTANNNTGTYQASPALGVAGALDNDFDTAITLNGSTQYVSANDANSLDLADVFTLEFWFKRGSPASGLWTIVSKGTNAYEYVFDASTSKFTLNKEGVATIVTTTGVVTDTTLWHHIAVTKNGATIKQYIDAVDVTGTVTNATCADTASSLNIGRRVSVGDRFAAASLDEVAVYPTALTGARILAHYQAGKPWTDISTYVLAAGAKRGRQADLNTVDAGQAMITLNNSDRRFDPTHTGSPYSPNVVPMRKIRIRATHQGVTYPLFVGFVDSWPQAWNGPNVGISEVSCTDGFGMLAKVDVGTGATWPMEFSGARITRILDAAGWPLADRSIDTGRSELAPTTIALGSGTTALSAIQDVASAELGLFFIDGSGRACFHDRQHRRAASYLTTKATFGDANTGGLAYTGLQFQPDTERIWNDVQVSAEGSTASQAQDTTSQGKYLRRTLARNIPLAHDTEAADQAAFLLAKYKDPQNRLDGVEITPGDDNTLFVQALAREISDHVTVKRWPQQVGAVATQESNIEALQWSWGQQVWLTVWMLSTPAFTAVDWWILGDATNGVLGSTTKLTY